MSAEEKLALEKEIKPLPHQRLFFTTLQYGALSDMITHHPVAVPKSATVLLACGIARPEPLLEELKRRYEQVYLLSFPDHYYYTEKDILKIFSFFFSRKKECSDLLRHRKDCHYHRKGCGKITSAQRNAGRTKPADGCYSSRDCIPLRGSRII